jgi:hypothetical protein
LFSFEGSNVGYTSFTAKPHELKIFFTSTALLNLFGLIVLVSKLEQIHTLRLEKISAESLDKNSAGTGEFAFLSVEVLFTSSLKL